MAELDELRGIVDKYKSGLMKGISSLDTILKSNEEEMEPLMDKKEVLLDLKEEELNNIFEIESNLVKEESRKTNQIETEGLTRSLSDLKDEIHALFSKQKEVHALLPECPVCFEMCDPPTDRLVFCCPEGHVICSICGDKVDKCPTCNRSKDTFGGAFTRLREYEKHVGKLVIDEDQMDLVEEIGQLSVQKKSLENRIRVLEEECQVKKAPLEEQLCSAKGRLTALEEDLACVDRHLDAVKLAVAQVLPDVANRIPMMEDMTKTLQTLEKVSRVHKCSCQLACPHPLLIDKGGRVVGDPCDCLEKGPCICVTHSITMDLCVEGVARDISSEFEDRQYDVDDDSDIEYNSPASPMIASCRSVVVHGINFQRKFSSEETPRQIIEKDIYKKMTEKVVQEHEGKFLFKPMMNIAKECVKKCLRELVDIEYLGTLPRMTEKYNFYTMPVALTFVSIKSRIRYESILREQGGFATSPYWHPDILALKMELVEVFAERHPDKFYSFRPWEEGVIKITMKEKKCENGVAKWETYGFYSVFFNRIFDTMQSLREGLTGTIKIHLAGRTHPRAVSRFYRAAKENHYADLIIDLVMKNRRIGGGLFTEDGQKKAFPFLPQEMDMDARGKHFLKAKRFSVGYVEADYKEACFSISMGEKPDDLYRTVGELAKGFDLVRTINKLATTSRTIVGAQIFPYSPIQAVTIVKSTGELVTEELTLTDSSLQSVSNGEEMH